MDDRKICEWTIVAVVLLIAGCSTGSSAQQSDPQPDVEEDAMLWCDLTALECNWISEQQAKQACDDGDGYACEMVSMLYIQSERPEEQQRGLDFMARACEQGYYPTCTNYGADIRDQQPEQARQALEDACEGGRPLGCMHLASMYRVGEGGLDQDMDRAFDLHRKACNRGAGGACREAREMIEETPELLEGWKQDCDDGQSGACTRAGWVYATGLHVEEDTSEAMQLFAQACQDQHFEGCTRLGRLRLIEHIEASEVTEAGTEVGLEGLTEALQPLAVGCEGGEGEACHVAGSILRPVQLRQHFGLEAVVEAFEEACRLDWTAGCRELAQMYRVGDGVEPNPEQARDIYYDACLAHDLDACFELGMMYRQGQGIERDAQRARALFSNICPRDQTDACMEGGEMLATGDELEQSLDQAALLFNIACSYDDQRGCVELGTMYMLGQGIEQHPETGIRLLQQACRAGEEKGCRQLERFR